MSAVKFEPSYKLFEPGFPSERPIILGVDARLESPETLAIQYHEQARGNGDLRGSPPPGLLPMAAFAKAPPPSHLHGYHNPARDYQESHYQHYPQSFSDQQSPTYSDHTSVQAENASQLNQDSFATNNAVSQYMSSAVTVASCAPGSGTYGTRILLRLSTQYDLGGYAVFLTFGSGRVSAKVLEESQDANGYIYSVSTEAPGFELTGCPTASVPLALVIEDQAAHEIVRLNLGQFVYHDGPGGPSSSPAGGITRKERIPSASNADHSSSPPTKLPPPPPPHAQADVDTANAYDYSGPSSQSAQSPPYVSSYPTSSSMMNGYRTAAFNDHYSRNAPPNLIRSPTAPWSSYSIMDAPRTTPIAHTAIARPSLNPVHAGSPGVPQLIRTSTIPGGASAGTGGAAYGQYGNAYAANKAELKIAGKLEDMAHNWTTEEFQNKRRLVLFRKSQQGTTITTTFRPVKQDEIPPSSICISCILWAEKGECYVTSVDTISLLEQLTVAPSRFMVEEKNRIRRNLEGFHPLTVSKLKSESEEFFKVIMNFGKPKPRNIEKDVKVFPWKVLGPALTKIIGKYSASPMSAAMSHGPLLTTPLAYPSLPTPPVSASADHPAGYGMHHASLHSQQPLPSLPLLPTRSSHHHHESLSSPRHLTATSWAPYSTASSSGAHPGAGASAPPRTLSPIVTSSSAASAAHIRTSSPHTSALRLPTNLPHINGYDTRGSASGVYGNSSLSMLPAPAMLHHHSVGPAGSSTPSPDSATPTPASRGWDHGPYGEPAVGYHHSGGHHHSATHHHHTSSVYGAAGGYGDGAPRA